MSELVCELIVSLDGFAFGRQSPAYFGFDGADLQEWIRTNMAVPHRTLYGRKTYEALSALPEEYRDEGWHAMTRQQGYLFSRSVQQTDWPGLTVVNDDAVEHTRALKQDGGSELRTLGSVSLVQQFLAQGLVDRLKLVVCPLVLPQSGGEPLFRQIPDLGFDLVSQRTLDGRLLLLEYRPTGTPPYRDQ